MYDTTEIKVIEKIYVNPGIHKRELSKQVKVRMPSIDYSIKKIDSLLKKRKKAGQINYFINYSKEAITPTLYMVEYNRIERVPPKIKLAIREFLKELKEKPIISLIFGSYAKGNYTKDSDIDILLVYQKVEDSKGIENTAKKISMRTNTQISPVYLNYEDFRESFHDKTKEFIKNIRESKILLTGIEWWRQLNEEEA